MNKNETKSHCNYYSWGDIAPMSYGAFCMKKSAKGFSRGSKGKLHPQCWGCKDYKRER